MAPLGAAAFDALAFHGYGVEPASVDPELLGAVGELAADRDRTSLLTEMQSEGIETAVMIHHAIAAANASAYLQNDLVITNSDSAALALALLTDDAFELQGNFYAFSHFAKHTNPGWLRVDASNGSSGLLSSAWLAPDQSALTVVLINSSDDALEAKLVLPEPLRSALTITAVTRTVFEGLRARNLRWAPSPIAESSVSPAARSRRCLRDGVERLAFLPACKTSRRRGGKGALPLGASTWHH